MDAPFDPDKEFHHEDVESAFDPASEFHSEPVAHEVQTQKVSPLESSARGYGTAFLPGYKSLNAILEAIPSDESRSPGKGFWDRYLQYRQSEKDRNDQAANQNPVSFYGSGAAGLVGGAIVGGAGLSKIGLAGSALRNTAGAGAYGAASSLANGNADLVGGEYKKALSETSGYEGMKNAYEDVSSGHPLNATLDVLGAGALGGMAAHGALYGAGKAFNTTASPVTEYIGSNATYFKNKALNQARTARDEALFPKAKKIPGVSEEASAKVETSDSFTSRKARQSSRDFQAAQGSLNANEAGLPGTPEELAARNNQAARFGQNSAFGTKDVNKVNRNAVRADSGDKTNIRPDVELPGKWNDTAPEFEPEEYSVLSKRPVIKSGKNDIDPLGPTTPGRNKIGVGGYASEPEAPVSPESIPSDVAPGYVINPSDGRLPGELPSSPESAQEALDALEYRQMMEGPRTQKGINKQFAKDSWTSRLQQRNLAKQGVSVERSSEAPELKQMIQNYAPKSTIYDTALKRAVQGGATGAGLGLSHGSLKHAMQYGLSGMAGGAIEGAIEGTTPQAKAEALAAAYRMLTSDNPRTKLFGGILLKRLGMERQSPGTMQTAEGEVPVVDIPTPHSGGHYDPRR